MKFNYVLLKTCWLPCSRLTSRACQLTARAAGLIDIHRGCGSAQDHETSGWRRSGAANGRFTARRVTRVIVGSSNLRSPRRDERGRRDERCRGRRDRAGEEEGRERAKQDAAAKELSQDGRCCEGGGRGRERRGGRTVGPRAPRRNFHVEAAESIRRRSTPTLSNRRLDIHRSSPRGGWEGEALPLPPPRRADSLPLSLSLSFSPTFETRFERIIIGGTRAHGLSSRGPWTPLFPPLNPFPTPPTSPSTALSRPPPLLASSGPPVR